MRIVYLFESAQWRVFFIFFFFFYKSRTREWQSMLIYSFTFFEHGPHVLFLLSCLLLPTILFHAMQHYTTVYTRQLNGRESPVAQ